MLMSCKKKKEKNRSNNYGQVLGTASFLYNFHKILLILLLLRLNRLLILRISPHFQLGSISIALLKCSLALVSTIDIKPPCPMLLFHIPRHFIPNLSIRSLPLRAAWAFISLTPSRRLIRFGKKKVPYFFIHLFATDSRRLAFFYTHK